MSNPTIDSGTIQASRQKSASHVTNILLVVIGLNIVLSVVLSVQSGAWQHFVRGGVVIVFALITLYGRWLIQQDKVTRGIWWIIGGVLTSLLLTAVILADFGIVLGLIEVLLGSIIAVYTLPSKHIGRAVGISLAVAVATMALDIVDPAFRLPTSDTLRNVLSTLAVIVLLINVGLILRQFRSFPLRGKLIAILVGITAVTALLIGSYFIVPMVADVEDQVAADQIHDLEVKVASIEAFLANLQSDALFISQSSPLVAYLEAVESGDISEIAATLIALEEEFRIFAQNHSVYDQMRYLDASGQEIVRINVDSDGNYYVVTQDGLQNKGDRYYFQNSRDLESGQIYISPLDLNVEQGEIETPHKPMIRYGTPIYRSGELSGVIVTNVLAEKFLEPLGLGNAPSFLVDQEGYYLYHPDENKRWGRDLETGIQVSADYPDLVSQLFSAGTSTLNSADQFLAFTPVTIPGEETSRWYMVNFQAAAEVLAPVEAKQDLGVLLVGVTILFAAFVATIISRVFSEPLVSLTRAAEGLAAGNLDIRVSVDRQDEVGVLATAFNSMGVRVQGFVGSLETTVAARTRDLELAVEVGRMVSQVREESVLLTDAVEIIRSRFDLYYTQIYLVDDSGHYLVLKNGTGEAGKRLVARGHRLAIGSGSINGMVAAQKKVVLVSDTAVSPIFFPNPLLPDTRSEMAVPLLLGDQVVGVLDLQSDKPNGLKADALPAFEALAGQLAVAVQNASLFTEAVKARAEMEAQARLLSRTGWEDHLNAVEQREYMGYRYESGKVVSLPEPLETGEANGRLLNTPISINGEAVGIIQLEALSEEIIPADDAHMVATVAQQVAQQIENLRLLQDSQRYRLESEAATQRLTREGWDDYMTRSELVHSGYRFDQKEIVPLDDMLQESDGAVKHELTVRGEAIGYLAIADMDDADEDMDELVTAVTNQLSTHIETLRLSEQTEIALAATQQLYAASQALTAAQTEEEVIAALLENVDRSNLDRIVVALIDPDEQDERTILVKGLWDRDDQLKAGNKFSTAQLPIIKNLGPTDTILIENVALSGKIDEITRATFQFLQIQSVATIPIGTGQKLFGWLLLETIHAPRKFTAESIQSYLILAGQAAIVMDTVYAFQETNDRARELNLINRTAQAVSQHLEPKQLLETIYQQVIQIMSVDAFVVATYNAEKHTINNLLVYDDGLRYPEATSTPAPDNKTYQIVQSGESVLLNRTADEVAQRMDEVSKLPDSRLGGENKVSASLLYVPLTVGSNAIGSLSVQSYQYNAYSQKDVDLLEGVANHVAVAIANAQLFTQAEERAEELAVINQVARVAAQQLKPKQLFQTVHEQIQRAIPNDTFFVATYDANQKIFHFPFMFDDGELRKADPMEAKPNLELTKVIETGEPIIWNRTPEEMQELKDLKLLLGDKSPTSMVFVPLRLGKQIMGIISVQNYDYHAYSQAETNLLNGIANHMAVALENIRLFSEAQQRAEREAMINAISQKIQGASTVQGALQTAVTELGQALKLKKATVALTAGKETNGRN
ncbi:MAG: GAF domain-containing protein [Chloroflexi bacterium]|nr:GAF domain-containing protein [Chloroflexota bacterium]